MGRTQTESSVLVLAHMSYKRVNLLLTPLARFKLAQKCNSHGRGNNPWSIGSAAQNCYLKEK